MGPRRCRGVFEKVLLLAVFLCVQFGGRKPRLRSSDFEEKSETSEGNIVTEPPRIRLKGDLPFRMASADAYKIFSRPSLTTFNRTRNNWDLDQYSDRMRPYYTTARDVPAAGLIKFVAKELREKFQIDVPAVTPYIKTGSHRERAPMHSDWYYTRVASVFRHTYLCKNFMSVGKLRRHYGGNKNRGYAPSRKQLAAGGNIRHAFQALRELGFVEKHPMGRGHRCTLKGRRYLDRMALRVAKMIPPLLHQKHVELSHEYVCDFDEACSRLASRELCEMDFDTWDEDRLALARLNNAWNPETESWNSKATTRDIYIPTPPPTPLATRELAKEIKEYLDITNNPDSFLLDDEDLDADDFDGGYDGAAAALKSLRGL